MLEGVNEKLVNEDRHFVRLNSGRMRILLESKEVEEERLEYQRVCVGTEDGGVISLDWPANLDLEEERGLDTTLLLVPGTPRGSMETNVRSFVSEALKRGFFPVVMNPRGCAGSPLTTARLFTAADSDDISTAIQFISKARPWTTLMGVGWGYGANMLTKYLAESGEKTPLTAATCIGNPFDLEEATRSYSHHLANDQKLTGGLIDILRSNKELFQGKAKGFDVENALLAKSVRDFEKAISMISYGFEELEDFYSKSSTRGVVGNVKIPVLFIQNDDGVVPLFSIPRSLIAQNPFTSLLLCSCKPSSVVESGDSVVSWCQHLTMEWLTAVELGLLKGRHPLLKDVDVTINPSKGLALFGGRLSDKSGEVGKLSDLSQSNVPHGYTLDPGKDMLEDNDTAASIYLRSRQDSGGKSEVENRGMQELENGALQQISSVDAELLKEEVGSADSERGQVLQTAQVVMRMLDITMPGTLTEEKKEKVLTAIDQGETLLKAFQDAVPEDVRGKLTAAVTEILSTQGTHLKFSGLLDVSSGLKAKIQEKVRGISGAEGFDKDHPPPDQIERDDEPADSFSNTQLSMDIDRPTGELELDLSSEKSQSTTNFGHSQPISSNGVDISGSVGKDINELGNNDGYDELSKEKPTSVLEKSERGSEMGVKMNFPSQADKAGDTKDAKAREHKDQDGGIAQIETKEENKNQKSEDKTTDSSNEQSKVASAKTTNEVPFQSSEGQPPEKEGNDSEKRDNKGMHPVQDQAKSITPDPSPSTFSVSQALDALTGVDDSTQMAVSSVFGVIENMIDQLEDSDEEPRFKAEDNVKEKKTESVDEKPITVDEQKSENKGEDEGEQSIQLDTLGALPGYIHRENSMYPQHDRRTRKVKEEATHNLHSANGATMDSSQGSKTDIHVSEDKNEKGQLVGRKVTADSPEKLRHVSSIPLYVTLNQNGASFHNEFLRKYLISKKHAKSLDLDTTTALFLDYFPEEGQWKLLGEPVNSGISTSVVATRHVGKNQMEAHLPVELNNIDSDIEPPYVIFDTEKQQEPIAEYETTEHMNREAEINSEKLEELMHFVRNIVMNALMVEVGRRLNAADMKELKPRLARDVELAANAVSLAVGQDKEYIRCMEAKHRGNQCTSEKLGTLHGEHIIRAISSAVKDTSYLRRVIPVGVIVGSSLAALRKSFDVATVKGNGQKEVPSHVQGNKFGEKAHSKVSLTHNDRSPSDKSAHSTSLGGAISGEEEKGELKSVNNNSVMVGAVTAALGASALLVKQQHLFKGNETAETSSRSFKVKDVHHQEPDKLESESEKNQNNIVTSLAEKAMSAAGPVVPVKEDGEVDHERLVALLTDLGQRGGLLRLVGKLALLWGGIRGAMSLTDRLILFLRLAERPLFQRILGFSGMVLVLWSPVVVPMLPTLVQGWTTNTPSRIAQLVCIIGLYAAIMILVMIWGRRIRGYEDPLEQYGLDLTSSRKIKNFLMGLVGGVTLVLSIHTVNALLGCVSFSWPPTPSPLNALTRFKLYGQLLMLAGQGIVMATGVSLVEELLFRSWLPKEIAADLGYHQGIVISGLAFSLFQRSPKAIPGLWLLSLALAGAQQRSEGSLSAPIGLRAGIMASSFVLQKGGFLTYLPNFPLFVAGTHPFQPFSGVVGFAFALVLAILLYPNQLPRRKKFGRSIQK